MNTDARSRNLLAALIAVTVFPFLVNGYVNSLIAGTPALYWSFELTSWIVIPVLAGFVCFRTAGMTFEDLGLTLNVFNERRPWTLVLLCAALCAPAWFLYTRSDAFFTAALPGKPFFEYESVMPEGGVVKVLVVIYFSLSAGVVEEILYRGALFRLFSFFPNPALLFLVASPMIFASVHWEGGGASLVSAYVFGVFACGVFLAVRNLWPLIVAHIFTDFMEFI